MHALGWFRFGCALAAVSCGRSASPEATPQGNLAQASSPSAAARTLEPTSFGEALRALSPYADRGDTVLEVRATAERTVLQVRLEGTRTIAEYVYDGRVLGPIPTHLAGSGALEANLFDLGSVNVDALTKLFAEAKRAVDPSDGQVTEVVLRRHLPFATDVRARIYVASPRLSGHLDADAQGKIILHEEQP